MALCQCSAAPRCEYHHCVFRADKTIANRADWTVWLPSWAKGSGGLPGRVKFMCDPCKRYYHKAMTTPIKGLDKPKGADDSWRPSLLEVVHHGCIALDFEQRNDRARLLAERPLRRPDDERRYTLGQLEQLLRWRSALRKYFPRPAS